MDQQQNALQKLRLGDPVKAPYGVDPIVWHASIPKDNQMTPARVALGKKLYFDTRLSADQTVSCATCHDVTRGFTDQRPVSEGIKGQLGRRNAPTTANAALLGSQFLDGRAATLEDQAKMPIVNPIEMGMPDEKTAVRAISTDPEYRKMFRSAYGRKVNYEDIGRAIAAFERTLMFLDAPFDRFAHGDRRAISANAKAGWKLFNGKARCVTCHPINGSNPLGTDNRFHNIGVSARDQDFEKLAATALKILRADSSIKRLEQLALQTDMSQLGRFVVTRNPTDMGGFRTSQLRNVGITGPYMHDGSLQTLWDVMDFYNKGGEVNPHLDGGMEPLALSDKEVDQMVAFLFSLTDARFAQQNEQQQKRQRKQAQKQRPFKDDDMAFRRRLAFEPAKK